MSPRVTGLIPMAHVADVQRSVSFYELLGLKVRNTLKADWAGRISTALKRKP